MQRTTLRPLRLVRLHDSHRDEDKLEFLDEDMSEMKDKAVNDTTTLIQLEPLEETLDVPGVDLPLGETEARNLLKRTPNSYLLNQAYGLWVFASLFLLTVIITRKVTVEQYGIYAVASAASNTIAYIVALGLEDATTTFVPRLLAEHGRAAAASLIRRLLALRIGILILSVGIMLFGLPLLATLIAAIPFTGSANAAAGLRDPHLLGHITPIAFYVLGNGISSLLTAVCAAQMRLRLVFIVGSMTQLLLLCLGFLLLQLGWGIDSILWLQAICTLLNTAAFAFWQAPLLFTLGAKYKQAMKPVLKLGISAWLTNLVSGALLKQVSIILLGYFTISLTQIAYFNLSFQLGHAASLLLVSGFGGVIGSALAAAFVGRNYERLARSWQALIKIETLLSAPVLMFCLFNAQNIAHALYGSNFDPVGPLLAIFLIFNILIRVIGTTVHQYALYVMGKPRLVVLAQGVGLATVVCIGIALIPRWGPAGALIADGLSQMITGGMLLAFLWRDLPRKYPLGYTLRILVGLIVAALPGIIWHPTSRILLGMSGVLFLCLSVGLLLLLRPLNAEDLQMASSLHPGIKRYLQRFAR